MLKQMFVLTGLAVLGLATTAAHADTITDDGAMYTLTYSSPSTGVYDVFLTVDATNYDDGSHSADPNYLQAVGLNLDDGTDVNVSLVSAPSGFTNFDAADKGVNNNGCASNGKGFFCIGYPAGSLGSPAGDTGDVYNFEFVVTGSVDLGTLADTVEANYNYTTTNKNTGAISTHNGELADDSITLTSAAPEPSSLMLLGTGLLGAAGAARRRWRA